MRLTSRAIALLAALVGAGAWFHPDVPGGDLWLHLAAGRETIALGHPPTTDHFSFSAAGQPWMNHEWLWGTAYWLVYRWVPDAVLFVNLTLVFTLFAVWYITARRHVDSPMGAALALWASAATCFWFLDIRPHEVTLLLVGVIVATRERPWARWMWAPLIALWSNIHGGFAFGLGTIGLFALVRTWEASRAEDRVRIDWTLWLGVVLAVLAVLCNPWGWRIVQYPLAFLDRSSPYLGIIEWTPTPFSLDLRTFSGRYFWLLGAACLGGIVEIASRIRGGRSKGDLFLVLLAAVAALMALKSRRFIPLFALTSLPLTARLFQTGIAAIGSRLSGRASARDGIVGPALALGLALVLWRNVRIFPHPLDRATESYFYPKAALRYAVALDAGTRVVNTWGWGGYIMLQAPSFKILIDGRANTLYSDAAYYDYALMMSSPGGFHSRLLTYAPDLALIPSGLLAKALGKPPFSWVAVYTDQVATVLLPPGSPRLSRPLPSPDEVVGDEPQWQLAKAAALAAAGQTAAARQAVEPVLAKNPQLIDGYRLLIDSYAHDLDTAGIAAALAHGVAAEPRMTEALHQIAGHAFYQAGDRRLAAQTLERGVPRGPFVEPGDALEELAFVRTKIDHP